MQHFNKLMAVLLLLGFLFHLSVVAQPSAVVSPGSWEVSNMQSIIRLDNGSTIRAVLDQTIMTYSTYFGFYSIDDHSFILSIVIFVPQAPVIWSANPDNPVNRGAILNFTREGDLLLHNGDGTLVWSTDTKSKSVGGMRLEVSGNLVLFNQENSSVWLWQSFDHPTDTLVLGQSLCKGMNLSVRTSNTKWPSSSVYLSADWNGLQYSFKPADYTKLFESSKASTHCCTFANGSFGFPDNIFFLPSARSLQFMRLETDGHLRLYEMQGVRQDSLMILDVLSTYINFCDYPMACGDYGVCNKGQCSCPSLSNFRFQNERLPSAGCIPLRSPSCDHAQDHQLLLLNNVSYFSDSVFFSLATSSVSERVCKQSCLIDCSCKAVVFRKYYNVSDDGYCLLLLEQMVILFAEDSSDTISAFVKIEGNRSGKRMISIVVGSVAGFFLISILICVAVWKTFKTAEEPLFDGIPGIPKRFSFHELKVATDNFSIKLGGGGFGSVFKGRIGKETIVVKRLEGVEQGMEEFLAEVKTIGRIHNFNLVRLVGFCAERSHKLLVYEYLSNSSLDRWIFQKSSAFNLSWKTRRGIILAIARGLSYLHEQCEEKIAHLDIKPQNILLDDKFNAKLSDFGLSKMINRDQSKVMTRMRATRGYLAPEWLGSKITEKADIYSFGIVMVEIICGRENLDESQPEESIHLISLLQEKARSGQLSDLVDSSSNDMKLHMEEAVEAMKLAMWCLQVDSNRRPLMSTIAKVLEGVMRIEAAPDCTFVPSFASSSNNTNVVGSISSYVPSESHLSEPR